MPKGCSNPGHGGTDSGALGSKAKEKDINLQVSVKFAKRMRELGFEMVETRTADSFVSLSEIARMANRYEADFFQSNHCNAGGGRGFEVYALPGGKAEKWAAVIEKHLSQSLGIKSRGVKTNQNFFVLVHTEMPAVLVELAFIDNPQEQEMLLNSEWQDKAVEAMAQAWCEIYEVRYTPPVRYTEQPELQQLKKELVQEGLETLVRLEEIFKRLAD